MNDNLSFVIIDLIEDKRATSDVSPYIACHACDHKEEEPGNKVFKLQPSVPQNDAN